MLERTDLTTTLNQAGVSNFWVTGGQATMVAENVSRTGRYVRIQRNDTNSLVLPEVKVLGAAAPQSGTQNVVWQNTYGVTVSGNSITKVTGNNWANGAASSQQAIVSGDGYVQWTASETNSDRMLGLSRGDSNLDYPDIDYAFYTANGAVLYVFENGVNRGNVGSYANGDTLKVGIEGGVVKYRKNGTLLYTSTVAPAYPLVVDTSIYGTGGTLNSVVISGNLGGPAGGGAISTDIEWLVTDQLGTPRMVFDKTGSLVGMKRHDYLPFGEELAANLGVRTTAQGYGSNDGIRQKFTQQERDGETGLDYYRSRYYASVQGRFTSPDSVGGSKINPQTLNLYSYVLNNPLRATDPTGHWAFDVTTLPIGQDPQKPLGPAPPPPILVLVPNVDLGGVKWKRGVVTVKIIAGDIIDDGLADAQKWLADRRGRLSGPGIVFTFLQGPPEGEAEPESEEAREEEKEEDEKRDFEISPWRNPNAVPPVEIDPLMEDPELATEKEMAGSVPPLNGETPGEQLRDAVQRVANIRAGQSEKGETMVEYAAQIAQRFDGWKYQTGTISDGSFIVFGPRQVNRTNLVVITPQGAVWVGHTSNGGLQFTNGQILPSFGNLREIRGR